ncbi:hypothetical protein [Streptomyces sp. NPDC058755]|uniref:hypothetical protein n=1 Tax=Streptomyces sp. NPDC058755 TaxID=3346624 RepID=UPI003696CD8A
MTRFAIQRSRGSGNRVTAEPYRFRRCGKARQPRRVQLATRVRADGNAEPVMTITQPDEN